MNGIENMKFAKENGMSTYRADVVYCNKKL